MLSFFYDLTDDCLHDLFYVPLIVGVEVPEGAGRLGGGERVPLGLVRGVSHPGRRRTGQRQREHRRQRVLREVGLGRRDIASCSRSVSAF